MPEEPAGVNWENFGIAAETKRKRLVVAFIILMVVLVVWTVFYWPWSAFTWATVGASSTVAFLVETILGLFIALGNAIVSQTVQILAQYYGFRYSSHMATRYLLVIVPCVLINVMADLYVTWNNAVTEVSTALANNSDFRNSYGMRLIMTQIFALLVPGYVFIPYFFEPMATLLLPYWLGIWRIKQDTRISSEHAERLLVAGDIDIVNPPYCDMICCTTTFFLTFFVPTNIHWKMFLALIFFAVFLYSQNRIRILRWQTTAYFGTQELHRLESYLFALPLGTLAAAFGSQLAPSKPGASMVLGFCFFVMHGGLHTLFVRYFVPAIKSEKKQGKEESYSQAVERRVARATYRNTNPIEVLKSRRSVGQAASDRHQGLVYYKVGKENLQPQAFQRYVGERAVPRGIGRIVNEQMLRNSRSRVQNMCQSLKDALPCTRAPGNEQRAEPEARELARAEPQGEPAEPAAPKE